MTSLDRLPERAKVGVAVGDQGIAESGRLASIAARCWWRVTAVTYGSTGSGASVFPEFNLVCRG